MILATIKRNVQFWPFISASMGTVNSVLGALLLRNDSTLIPWFDEHPRAAVIGYILWALLPFAYGFVSLFDPLRLWRYVTPGRQGPREFEGYLRECWGRLSTLSSDPNVKIRVTLFIPEEETKLLYQVARYEGTGKTAISATRVRWGTCDVGDAFSQRRPYQVKSIPSEGFHGALVKCGLAQDEIEAHRNKERKFFGSIPLFQDPVNQTPYKRVVYPEETAVAVLSVDAATADALPDDWYNSVLDLLPGLVEVMRQNKATKHLFTRR
ncbi:MAG: hypothetical protein ACOZNI_13040 [Myxococcota bacterium]